MSNGGAAMRRSAATVPVETQIVALDGEGCGVAEVGGRKLRVDGALAGERVAVEVVKKRRRFDRARLVAVLVPSPHRVLPSCEYFHFCGGCRFQHLAPEAQRAQKERELDQALADFGVPGPLERDAPITGPYSGYRRKARLGVRYVSGKGGALVGFREKRGNLVADIRHCEVLVPSVGQRIHFLRELVSRLDARDRIPQIEIAAGDDATALIVRHLDPLSEGDRIALREFARGEELRLYLQPGGLDSIAPLWPEDPPPLRYRIPEFELELAFEPADFVQVNAAVNRALVSRAVSWLEPGPADRVLDLFCGIGNFSLALARRGGFVCGVEASDAMVAAARGNAEVNAIENATFDSADLSDADQVEGLLGKGWSALLLDPPRSGAAVVVEQLSAPLPSRIVYVSCNPQTFARDAGSLIGRHGFRLSRAGIVDMFPHTRHAEVIGLFTRSEG